MAASLASPIARAGDIIQSLGAGALATLLAGALGTATQGPIAFDTTEESDGAQAVVSAGLWDILADENAGGQELAALYSLEWRGPRLLGPLRPMAGGFGTWEQSYYGYGGIAIDVALGDHLVATPSTAAGLWRQGPIMRDIGGPVQFRTGLEVAYRVAPGGRLAIGMFHLSSAGLYATNPGAESLLIRYVLPLGGGGDKQAR